MKPEEAWEILVAASQYADAKLRFVAEAITSAATGEPMPELLQNPYVNPATGLPRLVHRSCRRARG
ncbi:hypothetical protein AB0I16_20570 [Streptomyces sp. NPDC050703]|uniref:hypothetical protein n=1 Tax=Streptomyces sp. NPDC050703 TaxID=3157218 RepID=UPI00342D357B